jgi:methylated-DNA-[protein]-cysteine S-methyltransferase
MNAYLNEIASPMGPVAFATNDAGALLGLWFRDGRRPASLEERLKRDGFTLARDEDRTAAAREQLVAYFAGERRSFDLPVARRGSDLQAAVWAEISRIPFGETRAYGQVAGAIGRPGEAIEVGIACAANPVLLVVPCHRVVGADGSLKGYAAGVRLKERLLAFEAGLTPTAAERTPSYRGVRPVGSVGGRIGGLEATQARLPLEHAS